MANSDLIRRYIRYCWWRRGKPTGRYGNLHYRCIYGQPVLYSYSTPIVAYYDGIGFLVDDTQYSSTTSSHRNMFLSISDTIARQVKCVTDHTQDQSEKDVPHETFLVSNIMYPLSTTNRDYFIREMRKAIDLMLNSRRIESPSFSQIDSRYHYRYYLRVWRDAKNLWSTFANTDYVHAIATTTFEEWIGVDPTQHLPDHYRALALGMMRYFEEERPDEAILKRGSRVLDIIQKNNVVVYERSLYRTDEERNRRYKGLAEFARWTLRKMDGDVDAAAWIITHVLQDRITTTLPIPPRVIALAEASLIPVPMWTTWLWSEERTIAPVYTRYINSFTRSSRNLSAKLIVWTVQCPVCDSLHRLVSPRKLISYQCPAAPDTRVPVLVSKQNLEELRMQIMLTVIDGKQVCPYPELPEVEVYDPEEEAYEGNGASQV